MLATRMPARKPLVTRHLLDVAARHGTGLDTRGLDHFSPTCESRALLRGQAEGLRAYHESGNRWIVPSGSRPNVAYFLYVYGPKITCTCDAGKSGRACKHSVLVRAQLAREAKPEPKSARLPDSAYVPAWDRETLAAEASRRGVTELEALVG